jgi:hypothetical protein
MDYHHSLRGGRRGAGSFLHVRISSALVTDLLEADDFDLLEHLDGPSRARGLRKKPRDDISHFGTEATGLHRTQPKLQDDNSLSLPRQMISYTQD